MILGFGRKEQPTRANVARHMGPHRQHRGDMPSGAANVANPPTLAERQAAAGSHNEPLRGNHAQRRQRAYAQAHPDAQAQRQARAAARPKPPRVSPFAVLFGAGPKVDAKTVAQVHKTVTKAVSTANRHHEAGGGDTSLEGMLRTAAHTFVDLADEHTRPTDTRKPARQARGGYARRQARSATATVMRASASHAGDQAVEAAKRAGVTDKGQLRQIRRQAVYDEGRKGAGVAGEVRQQTQRRVAHSGTAHVVEHVAHAANTPRRFWDRFTRDRGVKAIHSRIDAGKPKQRQKKGAH